MQAIFFTAGGILATVASVLVVKSILFKRLVSSRGIALDDR